MKVRLEEDLQLVITPESYVEQVALSKWADTVKGECALLVEAYAQHGVHPTALCAGHSEGSFIKDGVCQTCGLPIPRIG